MSQTEGSPRPRLEDPRVALPLGLWSGLIVLDGAIWFRRLAGALTIPLTAPMAWGSCLIVGAVSVAALVTWRTGGWRMPPRLRRLPEVATLVCPVLWGGAISPGLSSFAWGGITACCGMLCAATGLVCLWVKGCEAASEHAGVMPLEESLEVEGGLGGEDHFTQWQKRRQWEEGESIEGGAQVHFAAGQKEAIMHLSFCPPFAAVPELHAEDSLGGELEIRPEAVYPFGARLSVRRPAPVTEAAAHEVIFSAATSSEPEAA